MIHSSLAAALAACAFVLVAVVGPGAALQRLLRVRIEPALVLPLGSALAAGAYWLSLVLHAPWLFPAFVVGLGATLAWGERPRLADGPSLRGALPPFLGVVVFLALTQYGWNRFDRDGAFVLDPLVPYDTAFHVGLSYELAHAYPPQVPGVSGFPLGYHLGMDLVRAAALRWAGQDPYDTITRLDPTLWGLALILLLRSLAWQLGARAAVVTAVPWTLLAADFSFLLWWSPQAHWWADLLRGNVLLSLALANPILPALALTLGCLIAIAREEADAGRGWRWLAAVQAGAVPFFKIFMGAHLLLGLAVAGLFATPRVRRGLVVVALPAALATAALVFGQGGQTVEVALAPFDLVLVTRQSLGLPPLAGTAFLGWALAWIAASLGVRMLGLRQALVALGQGPTAGRALAAIALSAWPLGLLFRVSAPEALTGQKVVNDAAYLVEQGGPLLWLFATMALVGLATTRLRALGIGVLAAGLALPSTLQFMIQKNRWPNDALPAPMVRAMRALEAVSQPGDVVLQRPGGRFPPAPVVLIGRRVPYERFTPWLTQFASRADLEARHETVYRFFRTHDRAEAIAIARSLGARYVALYELDRLRFDTDGLLEAVHDEAGARVYRLVLR